MKIKTARPENIPVLPGQLDIVTELEKKQLTDAYHYHVYQNLTPPMGGPNG